MTFSPRNIPVVTTLLAVAALCCSSQNLQPGGPTMSVDSSIDACGITNVSTKGEVPTEHRATATACQPTAGPPLPDAGLSACTADSDCAGDGAYTPFGHCLHGVCSFDQCLTDSDCTGGVCGCSTDYYGGNAAYHPNICVAANCRVDSECGAGGYCSPSRGRCGTFEGFYCHGPSDTCVNPQTDCTSCSSGFSCVYAPTVGAFVCGGSVCNG
jgi:hypothetical protein